MQQTINQCWRFHLGEEPDAWKKDFDHSSWRSVTLPHDWAVEGDFSRAYSSGTGYLPGGTGWYRGTFYLPEEARGQRIVLHFDGIYKNGSVWCNSYFLGMRPNGYLGYSYDITHCACFGGTPNVISVRVEHEDISDSRWYTGSGVTRAVSVSAEDPLGFGDDGIVFTNPKANEKLAQIQVSCQVVNSRAVPATAEAECLLLDPNGLQVWSGRHSLSLEQGASCEAVFSGELAAPRLWSPDSPVLYTLVSHLLLDGECICERSIPVGLREFRFDPDHGFFLNGKPEKLKGVCVHHDAGCLGAAVRKPVWQRRLQALKEMGCNAIRTSHNPHMPALLDLCDELGFLVIDEAFDELEGCKNKWSTGHNVYPPKHQGYFKDFPQWGETDLRALVRRDRNHPCVILWSIANELDYPNDPYCHPSFQTATGNNDSSKPAAEREYSPARPNMERLAPLLERLGAVVKQEDPTRPVTAALAFPELSTYLGCAGPLDVVGYNYKEQFYQQDHQRFPKKPFLGSENSHSYEAWKAARDLEFIAGQFLWTGFDFLGEAQGWPVHGSKAGLMTTAGYPKGDYWFRKSLWAAKPTAALITSRWDSEEFRRCWTYAPGNMITVRCCTNQPAAELFLNGRSMGAKMLSGETGDIRWEIPFEEGRLSVLACKCEDSLETTGSPVSLKLKAWDSTLRADGEDVAQIEITLTDGSGRETDGNELLAVSVEGAGTLLGLENGDQSDNTEYRAPYRRTCHGKLLAYILAAQEPGPILVNVQGESVGNHSLKLEATRESQCQ